MSMDELGGMDGGKCSLQLRGVRPFLSDKDDITRHRCYQYLSDHDPRNAFDVEKYLATRLRARPEEEFALYEVDVA